MTIITQDLIDQAKAKDACRAGITWLEARPRTLEKLAKERPGYVLWAVRKSIGLDLPGAAEAIDTCARAEPWWVLKYAAKHLTPERLDACAEAEPEAALKYATERLTPEQIARCKQALEVAI